MSTTGTETRLPLYSWTPPEGLFGLGFLGEQSNVSFCAICQSDEKDREEVKDGLLRSNCCNQTFDMSCLETWKKTETNADSSLSCPTCRSSLDDRIFFRITADEYQHSQQLRTYIDQRKYSSLRDDLKNSLLTPFTIHSVVRHAASVNNLVALSILHNQGLISKADDELSGFDQSVLFTTALFKSTKAASFLLNRNADPNGTIKGRPLNVAMAMGDLALVQSLNEKNVKYLEDERNLTPLTALYLGKIAKLGVWKTLKGAEKEELENTLVNYCLDHNVDLSKTIPHPIRPERRATALHLTALAGNWNSFIKIIERAPQSLFNGAPLGGMVENLLGINSGQSEAVDPPIFDTLNCKDKRKFQFILEKMPPLSSESKTVRRGAPHFETLLNQALKVELIQEAEIQSKPDHTMTEALLIRGHAPSVSDLIDGTAFHVFATHCANYEYDENPDAGFFSLNNKKNSFYGQHELLLKMRLMTPTYVPYVHPKNKETPLHCYVKTHTGDYFSEETVKVLSIFLVEGSSCTAAKIGDEKGDTPLHHAVRLYYDKNSDNRKLIQDLLLMHSDPKAPNTLGVSAKQICQSKQNDVLREVYTRHETYPSGSHTDRVFFQGSNMVTEKRRLESQDPDYQRGFFSDFFN